MARITISYRRDDSGVITGRIFDRLVGHYGRDAIFRDIDDVPLGVDFREFVSSVLDASDIVLAIIGPRWLGPRGGQSRLSNEADPVRVEIEAALRKGVPLIPVLVMRGTMPQASQLPEPIKDFAFRNAIQVDTGQDFDVHIARLVRSLDRMLEQKGAARTSEPDVTALLDLGPVADLPVRTGPAQPAPTTIPEPAPPSARAERSGMPEPVTVELVTAVAELPAATDAGRGTSRIRAYAIGLAFVSTLLGIGLGFGVQRYLAPGQPTLSLPAVPADAAAAVAAQQAADSKAKALQDEMATARLQAEQDRKRLTGDLESAQNKAAITQKQLDEQNARLREAQGRADNADKQIESARQQAEKEQKRLTAELAAAQDKAVAAQKQLDDQASRLQKLQVRAEQAEKDLAVRKVANPAAAARSEELNAQVKSLGDQLAAEMEAHRQALAQIDSLNGQIKSAAIPVAQPPAGFAPVSTDAEASWSADDKRQIQNDLRALGHLRAEADGDFGPATRAAIKQFQSFEGVAETGVLLEPERQTLHAAATRLSALLERPAASPEGVAANAIKGAAARYARAWNFETGKGVKANPAEAAYWYGLAAADGEVKALTNLGTLLARGQGASAADPSGAASLWQVAAARGEATAMFNLGAMWERGIGVTADREKAKAWYQRSANLNDTAARAALKRLGI